MDEQQQPTDGNGVPLGDENDDIQPGALSAVDSAPVGTKGYEQDRAKASRAKLSDLEDQYSGTQKGLAGAYVNQANALQQATQRILGMQMAPGAKEQAYRVAAAMGTGDGAGRYNPAGVNAADAQNLTDTRDAEYKKQMLLAQYADKIPAASIGMYGAMGRGILSNIRVASTANNQAETAAAKAVQTPAKTIAATGMVWNAASGQYDYHPEIADAANAQKQTQQKNAAALKAAMAKANGGGPLDDDTLNFLADKANLDPSSVSRGSYPMDIKLSIQKRAAERALANNDTAGSLIARQQYVKTQQAVLKDFESGKTNTAINGINTAVKHMQVLEPLIDNLNNTSSPAWNELKNQFATQTGSTAPNDFNGVKAFVNGEISKAVLPGGGGEAERQELAKAASSASSPQALKSIVQKWKQLMAGKTEAYRQTWDAATGGAHGDMNQFLLPETQRALGIHPTPVQRPGQPAAPAKYTPDQIATAKKYGIPLQ